MERNREARKLAAATTTGNGLSRRRQRTNSLRDSPEEDGAMEMQEMTRLRDRGGNKKERDRRNKRRRAERLMHGRDGGDESTEEDEIDEDEEDEEDESGPIRMLPPNPSSSSSHHHQNHHHQQHHQQQHQNHHQRRSFPHSAKVVRAPPLRGADEMIGVPVPRKARTASAKRSHDYWNSGGGGGGGEQIYRQASMSPGRSSMVTPSPSSTAAAGPPPSGAPMSPSSSSISVKKKPKILGGHKQKPPKFSKPSSSSIQDEIEIEVAEVLFGLKKQSQGKQESTDAKSRVSSPVSNTSVLLPSSSTNQITTMTPKRKKPRPAKLDEEIHPTNLASCSSSASKIEIEQQQQQPGKGVDSLPNLQKNVGSVIENGADDFAISSNLQESNTISDPKVEESKGCGGDVDVDVDVYVEEMKQDTPLPIPISIPKPDSSSLCSKVDVNLEDASASSTKPITTTAEVQIKREEKFQIDLMAPPPSSLKSSPERDGLIDFVPDSKTIVPDVNMVEKTEEGTSKDEGIEKFVMVEKRKETLVEEIEKQNVNKERGFDLKLDLEKQSQESSKQQQQQLVKQQQQQVKVTREEPKMERAATVTSMPLPMTLAGWPSALPPGFGLTSQVPPLQGVVSLDGAVRPARFTQPPHFLPTQNQPRPKRCATHYNIAQYISFYEQVTKMNPLWPAAACSTSPYGAKPYNLNIMPPAETTIIGNPLSGMFPNHNSNSQDKGQAAASSSGHTSKEKGSVVANYMDGAQRKQQLVFQQATQPAVAGNILPGPFIFPITQQQALVAAANLSGAVKSAATSNAASASASSTAPGTQGKTSLAAVPPPTMSFGFQNMPANEAQYMAVLQNNGYPFPIPSHVGAPPSFRGGPHAQAMPFLNGSFYPQMLHPSQLQQQQPQQQPHPQSQPVQQGHQNTSTSSGSSSSQKHQQNQQQRPNCGVTNGSGAGSSQSFTVSKTRPQPPPQPQQKQHLPTRQARHLEAEMAGDDSSVTSGTRGSNVHKGVYDQNFCVPMQPQNALISTASLASGSGNHGEKQQQQSLKGGMELISSQSLQLSFGSFGGTAPAAGLDIASLNHAYFQSIPEAARKQYLIATQQTKIHQVSEEDKTVGDLSNTNEEKMAIAAKDQTSIGQSLISSRPDSNDQSMRNTSMETAARTLNLNCAARPTSSSTTTTSTATASGILPNPQFQQLQHAQQQQLLYQLQKQQQQHHMRQQQQYIQHQQQQMAATSRNKESTTSNANIYSDHPSASASVAGKFPNAHSVFPQSVVQGSSPSQSSQWKNTVARSTASTPSVVPMSTSSLKNHSQQQVRTQQGHPQISFVVNPKTGAAPHGQQQPPSSNQAPSPPMAVGSPTHSISRSAGGSPRTTSNGSKVGPTPTLSSQQQAKNSQSGSSTKSSPAGGRNVASILGNSHVTSTPSAGAKPQSQQQQQQHLQQQQQQQQQFHQKQALQQYLLSNAYMQAQSPQCSNTTAGSSGSVYYNQRRQPDQQQQQVSLTPSGLLGPPLASTGATASDPSKAIAAGVANNMKGVIPQNAAQFVAHSAGNSHPLMSAAFQYMHPLPAAQVKPAEQKQPAGNDNLHACWQPEKR